MLQLQLTSELMLFLLQANKYRSSEVFFIDNPWLLT